jgi:hypothetical protein
MISSFYPMLEAAERGRFAVWRFQIARIAKPEVPRENALRLHGR